MVKKFFTLLNTLLFLDDDGNRWLDATNKARAKFFSRPVKWNESLAEVALKVSRTCKMGHSAGKFGPMGEVSC